TPRVTAVVCVAEVPAPVTVIVYVPAGVVADVANVSREDPPELIGFVANVAVVPAGMPLALSVIDCALPEVRTVEMVEVPELPAVTLTEVGLAEMEKSLAGTVSDTVVEWVAETPVPVTVMVYVPGAAGHVCSVGTTGGGPAVDRQGRAVARGDGGGADGAARAARASADGQVHRLRVAAGDRGRDGARSGRVLVEQQAGRIGADGKVVRRYRQGHRRRVSGGGTRPAE